MAISFSLIAMIIKTAAEILSDSDLMDALFASGELDEATIEALKQVRKSEKSRWESMLPEDS